MEVAEKNVQLTNCGKGGRKRCRFTISTRFFITRLFKKRVFLEDFNNDLTKASKTGNIDDSINFF